VSLIDRAERLKKELTDKWVVVSSTAPELKRFSSLTGKVRTVNMNCRALVEFDNGIDISWYDIDPGFLTVVDGPRPKKTAAHGEAKTAAKAAPAANPTTATAPAATGSPLDKIRAAGAKPAAAAAAPAPTGSPLVPQNPLRHPLPVDPRWIRFVQQRPPVPLQRRQPHLLLPPKHQRQKHQNPQPLPNRQYQ
jgi:hypothetical protein